jgi:hypothetical protein
MTDRKTLTLVTTEWVKIVQDSLSQLVTMSVKMADEITELRARVAALEAATPAPQEEPTT